MSTTNRPGDTPKNAARNAMGRRMLLLAATSGLALALAGCSTLPGTDVTVDEATASLGMGTATVQGCRVVTDAVQSAGIQAGDLLPTDLQALSADGGAVGQALADTYSTASAAVGDALGSVADPGIAETVASAKTAMDELGPIALQAAGGDPAAIMTATAPLDELDRILGPCM